MPEWLTAILESWHEGKLFVERLTTISHDALHILAGTCLWLFLALLLRRPVTSWVPLAGTLAIVLVNELVDLWVEIWPVRAMQAGEGAKDVLTTIAIPLLLMLAFRLAPQLAASRRSKRR